MTKILKKALRIILAAAVLVFALTAADIWYYASFDQKQKADAVIVLGAGSWDSRVSPVFRCPRGDDLLHLAGRSAGRPDSGGKIQQYGGEYPEREGNHGREGHGIGNNCQRSPAYAEGHALCTGGRDDGLQFTYADIPLCDAAHAAAVFPARRALLHRLPLCPRVRCFVNGRDTFYGFQSGSNPMKNSFFATLSRMKYIDRWALMRNSREESLSEHSLEVAMIAHALCTIGNVRFGKHLDADRAALIGLYHDASEIITGDMPTPVKYCNDEIRTAYKQVEKSAQERLLCRLPDDLRPAYESVFHGEDSEEERYMRRLVKAADKLSAYIKCIEEEKAGNTEFRTAKQSTAAIIGGLSKELPEVRNFMDEFLEPYGSTLDELG